MPRGNGPAVVTPLHTTADGFFTDLTDVTDFANVLLYGREGSGKTTCLARLVNVSDTGQLLIINAEGGLKKAALRKRGVDTSRIKVWPDPNIGERVTYEGLVRVVNKVHSDILDDPTSWIGIGIDSITEVYQLVLDDVQRKRVADIQRQGKPVDPLHVDRGDYGDMTKMIRDLLRKIRDLPLHTVFTALERRDVDADTGKPQYGPALSPALQTDILGYVDMVLMCKAADEDGPFRALTRGNSRYRAKDRFDVLPRVLAEPMLDRVIGYMNGDITEDEDPFQIDLGNNAKTSQDRTNGGNADDDIDETATED